MATKNCPQCSKQVPVACKKCGCGHVFFATRRSATNRENTETGGGGGGEDMPNSPPDESKPTRRSGRVTRERPNFYDALQYENQTRRQKQLLRQTKQGKSEEQEEGSDEAEVKPTPTSTRSQLSQEKPTKEVKPTAAEPKPKRRRGRPPGITGRKPNQGIKITTTSSSSNNNGMKTRQTSGNNGNNGNGNGPQSPVSESAYEAADQALLSTVSAEKALQYNIVLQDINSKLHRVSWRAQ